jgi:hypothetical protein
VLEAVLLDALARVNQVVDVVEGVKVSDRGCAVRGEGFRVQVDHVRGLAVEANDVDAAGEGLEIDIRANRRAEGVHHVERAFAAVEK